GLKRQNMICPQCGFDMGNKNKCIRCGHEVKTLAVVDERANDDEPKTEEEKTETKVIDPCNVYLTHPYGFEDDDGFGDPFASLFGGLFGDPIGDLLGGLFGFDVSPRRSVRYEEEQPKKKRKQGPIVEVSDVEVIKESDGQSSNKSTHHADSSASHSESGKKPNAKSHKNPFRNRNGRR
ncbi:MAG: hypothetical protein K2L54_03670, partial [Clostridiales bacterium]|nr:hypothetical protein [Clostridiales bacterium]